MGKSGEYLARRLTLLYVTIVFFHIIMHRSSCTINLGYILAQQIDIETPILIATATAQPVSPTQAQYQHISPSNASSNVVIIDSFKRGPMNIQSCPYCNSQTRTRTVTSPNHITWIAVVALFFIFWPLFWLPLIMDKCKRTDHFCQKCHAMIGQAQPAPFEGCCVTHRS